jgi:Secretion system C-terminal sorting domain
VFPGHKISKGLSAARGATEYTTLTDIDGKIRAQYTPVDIGADAGNFTGVPPTPPPPDTTTSTTPAAPSDSTIVVPYPNPFSSSLTLAVTADTAGTAHIRIYSLTGKLVAAINPTVVTGTNIITIPTAAFPDGVYVLRVFIDNKRQTMEIQKKTS